MKKTALFISVAIAATTLVGQVWAEPTATNTVEPTKSIVQENKVSKEFESFLENLQKAIKEDNHNDAANLMSYPLNIIKSGKKITISTKKQFVQKYDRIITSDVKKQVLKQKAKHTFHNQYGYMIGDGVMWVSEINNQMLAYSINTFDNPYEVAGIDDPAAFVQFLSDLKKEVAANNKKAVAGMIDYPLNVNKNGKTTKIKTKQQFIKQYNKIMTKEVKQKLLAQKADRVFVNAEGVMIGDGEMWISQFGTKIAVYAINLQ
ncbi:hypothetical protein [Paenibacillus agilis]|uniref:Uncharacterized protein n=1 Tax=Paenibacillus agilis TaxID=3020863 RepID=A0A559J164_9BACL|nr:hypothetical protein [Paenibacillus agilis]TVX93630.1 hypothetical protein FPZ44_11510 [Paenibacillus agilis]